LREIVEWTNRVANLRVARASRVLVSVSHRNTLLWKRNSRARAGPTTKVRRREMPRPTRETRALPRSTHSRLTCSTLG